MLTTAKGSGIIAAGRLFEYGTSFIVAFLLARLLGAEQYGLYSLSYSAAVVSATIGAFGLNTALVRYVAISAGKRDEAGVWSALQIGMGGAVVLSVLTSIGLYLLAQPLAEDIFHEPKLIPLLRVFSLIIPAMTLCNVLADACRGFKRQQYPVIAINLVQPLVRMLLIVILALVGLNASRAAVATGLAILVSSLILLSLLNKEFTLVRPLRVSWSEIREIFNYSVPVLFSGLLKKFRGNIQALLLGAFSNVTSVGIFILANKVNTFGRLSSLAVMESAQPIIADLHARGDLVQMGRVYQTTSRWIFALNFPFVLIIMWLPGPILSIFGESFADGATVLTILAWANLINVSTGMSGIVIDMTGYTRLKLINSILQITLFVICNLLLIPGSGILGAALASLIVLSTMHFLRQLQVWFLFRQWPYNWSFMKPVTAGLVTVGVTLMLQQWLPSEANLLYAALHGMMILAVYASLTMMLGLTPEDRTVLAGLYRRARRMRNSQGWG